MFISVQDLEVKPVEFAESFAPGTMDFGNDISQQGAITAKGRAELIEEHHGGKNTVQDIRVVGKFSGRMQMHCARCLEPVANEVKESFDLLYRPMKAVKQGEEVSINEAETEIGFYQGNGLELGDVIKEQVLLAMPVKPLCREDCKGLCAHCGQNQNTGSCGCQQERQDPRWSALAGLRDQLKRD